MASFTDILDKNYEEVKRPPAYPAGTYLCVTEGLPEMGKSSRKQTPFLAFKAKILRPLEDVDKHRLAAWTEESGESISGKFLFPTFYEPNLTMMGSNETLAEWFAHLQLPPMSVRQAMTEAAGRQHLITLKHVPSEDGKSLVHQIASTAAA